MKRFIGNILNWLSWQKHIYWLIIVLFLVPNCILFFTEPLPVLVGIASLLLPLSLWIEVLLIARKPGIIAWCLLSKIILDGGQLVLLYLFGESVIAVDMFLNLTSSNASEAGELLGNIFLIIIFVFIFYTLPTLLLAFRSCRIKDKLTKPFRQRMAWIGLAVFVAGLSLSLLSSRRYHDFYIKNDIYPANAIYNLYFAIDKAKKNKNYPVTSADYNFEASRRTAIPDAREIYVLVVGETGRAMQWSLYGYERETTPLLEQTDGLIHFDDVITQSNNTHKSVPIILSAASAEDYNIIYGQKSIVTAFKEAGFNTLVIANQKLTTSMIGAFYREADTFIDMSDFNPGSKLSSLYDGELIPFLENEINKNNENLFIVLHTYGSHFNYHERYPKAFALYQPDQVDGIRASHKEKMRNAYDNSICYTDFVLHEVILMLQQTEAASTMLYLSDHGEDIFDDDRERYLHASPIPTYYQLHIPYVIWFSDNYRKAYPEKYRVAEANRNKALSTNSVFHTLLDLAEIETVVFDSSLAVTNPAWQMRDRMYLGDHDDPVPFWKMGLKQEDFSMLDKWKINYNLDK